MLVYSEVEDLLRKGIEDVLVSKKVPADKHHAVMVAVALLEIVDDLKHNTQEDF